MPPQDPQSWYVLRNGKTVGPLSTQEVSEALERRDFLGSDKVLGSLDKNWRTFHDDLYFHRFARRRPRRKIKLAPPRTISSLLSDRKEQPRQPREEPTKPKVKRPLWPLIAVLLLLAITSIFFFPRNEKGIKKGSSNEESLPPSSSPRPATDSPKDSDPSYLPRPPTRPRRL